MESGDRSLTLLHLRKTFSQYLKEEPRNHEQAFDKLLPLFNKIMSMYTPDELGSQFKEMIPFCNQLCTSLVSEIRRCANLENTRQAAERVYAVLRPSAECRGWTLLKSIIFIVNSGMPKVVESISKSMLPSTLVKLVYLFFDLSPLELNGVDDDKIKQEIELRQRLYDSLVMLMNSLCGHTIVAEELIQKDDLVLLFIGASTGTPNAHSNCWRDANFTFLCTIVAKALSSAVVKYVHSKGCIGYYLKNVRNSQVPEDKTVLLCNLLDLLKSSADTTSVLIEDFANAGGYDTLVSFCSGSSTEEQAGQMLESLRGLITAGDETIEFSQPSTPLSFYNFKLPQTLARSTATVRVSGAYLVLEKCFYAGDDWLCLLVLDTMAHLYKSEQMNYFIVDKYYSLYLFVESMVTKGIKVQEKVLELVEFVLRELNFIPCKELTALNVHIRKASIAADYEHLERWLRWLFQILPVNANVKDAFRELLVLETLLQIVQAGVGDHTLENLTSTPRLSRDHTKAAISTQMALDLLVIATKSNVLNAQFVTENLEMKMVKTILMEETQNQELGTATLVLIKNLLYLAKNEQLFSSLLQLLFSDPGNIAMCMVVLKLFTSVLLESHKVRIMFRRSGGYICLMTLLLHLEGSLLPGKEHSQTLQYISLIFHVMTVSMRYEPSNAKYFLTEVRPNIINSILRSIGCFSEVSKMNVEHKVWEQVVLDKSRDKLSKLHILFQTCSTSKDCNAVVNGVAIVPQQICNIFYLLRLLFDLALDNYEKPSNDIRFASDQEWLRSTENLETIPLVSWSARTILVHPSAVLCLLYLLPSISQVTDCSGTTPASPSRANHEVECQLEEWHAVSQFYIALVLKALLRSERNQQIMCQHDMPSILLDVGSELFLNKSDRHHPLLSPFHYLFERLACQAMHPSELRKFLRLDQPLCCQNLDDEDEENAKPQHYNINGGGPVPIHRVKALVSMLTPRNHSLVHPPAFVEFDLAVEGFACLFIPCIVNPPTLHSPSPTDRTFPPANGLTFLTWIYLDDSPVPTSPKIQMHQFLNQPINLISLVRNYESNEIHRRKSHMAIDTSCSLENYLTCFIVQLNMVDRAILVSTAEHSVVDELRKDFSRPPDTFVSVPLSEQFWNFHSKQWTHVAVVLSRQKGGQVEVFVNGKLLASQKINYVQTMGGGGQGLERQLSGGCAVHGIVGTPPFLRRATCLRWKMASMYLVDEPMSGELVKKVASMQPHYVGNLQTSSSSDGALVPEDKLLLSLNAISTTEVTAQNLRSMIRKTDCETIASLLGISPTDSSTPIRILWNTVPASASNKSIGAIVVGYLGMRTFAPCPVSALLDSIGGLAPLLGLVAMCSDSHGLYASLKVLVSAVLTNRSIVNTIVRTRGYQTLAMLLEEKAHLINSHILHLVLSLAGTVDGSKTDESAVIPNLQTFDDLLCDLDVWANAPDEVKKLLFEHFYELVIDNHKDNLNKVRTSSLLSRLLIFIFENSSLFPVKNDIVFRLIGAIVQPPCDQHSLLRLGQTISATSSSQPNGDEKEDGGGQYPFHIAELERLLLDEHNSGMEINRSVYCIYVRNRLLNMIMTTLAHSSGQVNKELSESLVNTLGFGWIVSLCAPGVHPGTLFLALKILVSVTKYPLLLDKFREGSCNGGWLSDADSVIRNRAAVLLGFSVSAHGGAVGSYVDINPELSHCSGFAALEHLMSSHADKPFAYLAMLAILFGQHQPNIQPIDDFNIDLIWSHVFALNEKRRKTLSTGLRTTLSWCFSLLPFSTKTQKLFFLICHTEAFVVSLFTTLIPPIVHQPAAPLMQITTFAEQNKQNSLDLSPTSAGSSGRCVRNILEQLTNILLNDLCLSHDFNNERLFDALVEYLDGGGSMCSQQSVLFTELINACLDRFMSSNMFFANSTCMQGMPFQAAESQLLSPSSETTAINVVYFLSRVIDSVWNCLYRGNPIRILKCFLKLLAESHASNKAAAQLNCTEAHTTALFRIVLYLLSRPIDNVDTQMSVLDTLAEIVRNQHLLLAPLRQANSSIQQQGHNCLFYGALVHLVFMLSEKPDIHHHHQKNSHLERGSAQVAMCAQTVWGMLWQQKKAILDDIFKRDVDLELYTARAVCGEQANRFWLQFVDSQTDGSNSTLPSSQPNSAKFSIGASGSSGVGQIQSKLTKVARSGLQKLVSQTSRSGKSMVSSMATGSGTQQPVFQFDRMNRIEPETFYMWIRVHISLLNELMKNHSQRYHEWHQHVRKWCMQEWHNTEAELTRVRGLWGPEQCSKLEKYQLDITEGPHRIRKKLVPNNTFYQQYPYRPALDVPEAKAQRAKVAISKDSKLYYEKMQKKRFHTMDERIVDHSKVVGTAHAAATAATVANNNNAQQQDEQSVQNMLDLTSELNLSMIKRMVQKNLPNISATSSEDKKSSNEKLKEEDEEEEDEEECILDDAEPFSTQNSSFDKKLKEDTSTEKHSIGGSFSDNTSPKHTPSSASLLTSNSTPKKQHHKTSPQLSSSTAASTGPDNQTLLRLLEQGEQLHSMFRCARVQGLDTLEGLLLFGKDHYYVVDGFTLLKTREIRDLDFLPEQFHDPIIPYMAMGSNSRPSSTKANRQCSKFGYDDIKEVHKRRYLLQPIALEVFSADGRNYLLAFPRKIRDRVYQKLVSMAKGASSDVAKTMAEHKKLLPSEASSTGSQLINSLIGQQSITQKWQRGEINNFHYLMYLNTLAGRSYNDLSQYPVFPWILKDYDSDQLDLTNPTKTFRDLSRPMGAQTADRLAQFLKRFREWDDPSGDTPPYMYGTHYSSAMIVLSYLVRLEPFTQQFLKLQGGHFDLADRMFHSIKDAYISASKNNMADVKELIPEFFYLPETFLNQNAFDLGVKQSGIMLNHVQLPQWAHGCPHEFVRVHREALECDYVSEHLHEWIDLIFGYRQSGDPARESNNVFHHLFYEQNVDFDNIDDPLTRNATLGFINNFGQTPTQLFKKPHPQRRVNVANLQQGSSSTSLTSMTSVNSSSSAGSGSIVSPVKGVTMPKLFYNCLESLKPSAKPVKELKAAIGEIVFNEKSQVIVLEQNKILLPPTSYMAWGFHDRSVRVGAVGTDKSHCVLETNDVYEITCMASADGKVIFGGLTTGTVVVWSLSPPCSSNLASLQLHPKRALDAHTDIVTGLAACPAHNFIVSSSRDHTAVIWHLTQLTFIRQLKGHSGAITALAVNDVKGEIATASGSQLFLWSLNGVQLAVINTAEASLFGGNPSSLILCLGFSTLNEWDARNVVMCGTSDGLVKIYSCELRKVTPAEPEDCVFGSSETSYFGAEPSDVNNSSSRSNKAVKDHLLKRQQRIQNHHYNRKLANKGCANLDVASSNKNSCSSTSSEQQGSGIGGQQHSLTSQDSSVDQPPLSPLQTAQQSTVNPATSSPSKEVEWRRSFQLRRVLSEHTAFSQQIANAHPAPITCLRPTKDQRSLLVGDGVGRVWLWTIDNTINSNGTAF